MTSGSSLRIGTRDSALALYQTKEVQGLLNRLNVQSEIVEITSDGDQDLSTPLYEMGIQGIFTKSLDIALLQNRIDLAVHSIKDIPTKLAQGLTISAMLKRGSSADCLVLPAGKSSIEFSKELKIATSSLRRKSQWLGRYPDHILENLRGNVQTRLDKLDNSDWNGAIFAQAALERLSVSSHTFITLNWMLPSPGQGAIGVVCRIDDEATLKVCSSFHDGPTGICVSAERDFLAALQGGCAVPIAAHAQIENGKLLFKGNVFSLDATQKCEVEMRFEMDQADKVGKIAAQEILRTGGIEIIKTFRPSF